MTHRTVAGLGIIICLLSPALDAHPGESKRETRLEKGSAISARVKGRTVGEVIALVEKATGNQIAVLDDFHRPDAKALAKTVGIDLVDASFWDAVQAIERATGYTIDRLDGTAVELKERVVRRRNQEPAGDVRVEGSFLVVPEVNTFFQKTQIRVLPEPWIPFARVVDYRAEIVLADGTRLDGRPSLGLLSATDRELSFDLEPKLEHGSTIAKTLELEARLELYFDLKDVVSSPLETLAPKPIELGGATARVTNVEEDKAKGEIKIRVEIDGTSMAPSDIALRGSDGKAIRPRNSFSTGRAGIGSDEGSGFELVFSKSDVAALESPELVFQVPKRKRFELGKLSDIQGKAIETGLSRVKLEKFTKTGESIHFEVTIAGEPLALGDIELLSPDGKVYESGGGVGTGTSFTIQREVGKLAGNGGDARLVVHAATEKREAEVEKPFELAPRAQSVGDAELRVLLAESRIDDGAPIFLVRFELDPPVAPLDGVELIDPQGRKVEQRSAGMSNGEYFIEADGLSAGKSPLLCRLRVEAPHETIEHVLRTTLEDVKVASRRR